MPPIISAKNDSLVISYSTSNVQGRGGLSRRLDIVTA